MQGPYQGWPSFQYPQPPPHDLSMTVGGLIEGQRNSNHRIDRLEDSVNELQDQVATLSTAGVGAPPSSSRMSRLKEVAQLLASLKELCIWLGLLLAGLTGIAAPETVKAWGLALIGGG